MAEIRTAKQLEDIHSLLRTGKSNINIAVAYVTNAGLDQVKEELEKTAEDPARQIRFLVGVDPEGVTDADAIKKLLEIADRRENLLFKAFVPAGKETFHPKLFMAHSRNRLSFLAGSYNLTLAAFQENVEYGVYVRCAPRDPIGRETLDTFNRLWEDERSRMVDYNLANAYAEACEGKRLFKDKLASDEKGTWAQFKLALTPPEPIPQWPSRELAYLLGIIHARGRFIQEKSRIQINLSFALGEQFDLHGKTYDSIQHVKRVRERIINEAAVLPNSRRFEGGSAANSLKFSPYLQVKAYPAYKQVVFMDFAPGSLLFNVLLNAFNKDAGATRIPSDVILSGSTDLAVRFLRGYCLASATMSDSFEDEIRIEVIPKAPGEPVNRLMRSKTQASPELNATKGKAYM